MTVERDVIGVIRIMKTLAVALAIGLFWVLPVHASLVQTINAGSIGFGEIQFTDPVGGDETDIAAFSFEITASGDANGVILGLSNITSASYSFQPGGVINSATFGLQAQLTDATFSLLSLQLVGPATGPYPSNSVFLQYALVGGQSTIGQNDTYTLTGVSIPEPGTLALLGLGLAGLAATRRRKQ